MSDPEKPEVLAASLFLRGLKESGIDYIFANAGTDFPSIIEALAEGGESGHAFPEALTIPHETVAVGMAHGYFLVTGRPQAVMVHVNVGLANAAMGIINAASDNAAMLICSGRTPVTEAGRTGSKSTPIHWGQEMRDQSAMVREVVKWDHELRYPEQAGSAVARAASVAMSDPPGPVYLSLPREVLAEKVSAVDIPAFAPSRLGSAPEQAIKEAAQLLTAAENPLIISQGVATAEEFAALSAFAEKHGVPVAEFFATKLALPSSHPANVGRNPSEWLSNADVVLVVQSLVPWIPDQQSLRDGAKVIGISADPLYKSTPIREFPVDISLAGGVADTLLQLSNALDAKPNAAARLQTVAQFRSAQAESLSARVEAAKAMPMGPAWVSRCISDHLPKKAIVFNELGVDAAFMNFDDALSYFSVPLSGGLGWGMTAALGAQLAAPDRQVVACIGDGSYMFANPVACHQMARALNLPILTIVMNNGVWNAVRRATLHMYPDGKSASANIMPLTNLSPSPDHCLIAKAHGAYAEKVESWEQLPQALGRALEVTKKGNQALLEVIVGY